jgi:hypothetical protein
MQLHPISKCEQNTIPNNLRLYGKAMKIEVVMDAALCGVVISYRRFGEAYFINLAI